MFVPCLLHTVYSILVDVGEKSYHHIIDIKRMPDIKKSVCNALTSVLHLEHKHSHLH